MNDVKATLEQLHELSARRYLGDYAACDILIDLEHAIKRADLTGRQREALYYVYVEGLTQADAGKRMGVGKPSVNKLIKRGEEAIK